MKISSNILSLETASFISKTKDTAIGIVAMFMARTLVHENPTNTRFLSPTSAQHLQFSSEFGPSYAEPKPLLWGEIH